MGIDFGKMVADTHDQFVRILEHFRLEMAIFDMPLKDFLGRVLSRIVFIECLQGDHARLSSYPNWHAILNTTFHHY